MNAEDSPTYLVSRGDPLRDRELMLSIWQHSLGAADHMATKYEWFYLQCPYGMPLIQKLRHAPSDSWVGVCSMGIRRMLWQGREIRSGVLVDLAVLANHRSLGPALMMQQALIETALSHVDVTLGFPNPKAAAVFKRIRYSKFSDIVRYAKILHHATYLRRRMPAWLAVPAGTLLDAGARVVRALRRLHSPRLLTEWSSHAVDEMTLLWQHSSHGNALIAIRDADHVRWRFDQSPLVGSRHLLIRDAASGSLRAWFTTRQQDGVLHVMDFWSIQAINGMESEHIDVLIDAACKLGCTSVSMQTATTAHRLRGWLQRGFVGRESRPVFGYWSIPPNQIEGSIDLHLTMADEDE